MRRCCLQTSVTSPEEMSLFGKLSASGRLGGRGVLRHSRGGVPAPTLAIDDRQATIQARRTDPTLRMRTTQDLMVSMIREDLLDIAEADRIKDDWAVRHRFRLKLRSFRKICP